MKGDFLLRIALLPNDLPVLTGYVLVSERGSSFFIRSTVSRDSDLFDEFSSLLLYGFPLLLSVSKVVLLLLTLSISTSFLLILSL